MFICTKCAQTELTDLGKEISPQSLGPCEICQEVAICYDAFSGWAWVWKQKPINPTSEE